VLEMVAMEMAAPDPDEIHDLPIVVESEFPAVAETEPAHVTTPPIVEPISRVVRALEPEPELPPVATQAPALQPSLHLLRSVAAEPKAPRLGPTRTAGGILPSPRPPANDPLAPIRRMSQAEKIAFFS